MLLKDIIKHKFLALEEKALTPILQISLMVLQPMSNPILDVLEVSKADIIKR